jgi:transcriptional regulator with XRE-family HTH domain
MSLLVSKPQAQAAVTLGQALRARRKSLGLSAVAAAEAAGISRVTWHRLEKGGASVAAGSLLAAAAVLGLRVELLAPATAPEPSMATGSPADHLPLRIRLRDFPQLRGLAWQVADDTRELTPREALDLYERNWRHVQADALEPRERALIGALQQVYGKGVLDV